MMMMMSSGFWNVLRIAFSAGLGGFIYGYHFGVINYFPPYMNWDGPPNNSQINTGESRVPWILLPTLASSLGLCARVTDPRFKPEGIKPPNLAKWPCPLFILGAFLIFTFPKSPLCLLGIILIGFETGYIFVGSTIYLVEISPTRIRGAMVATFFLQIAAGQIVYYIISLASILHLDDSNKRYLEKKQWMLGIIQFLFMLILRIWLPDSPNRLYAMGKKEEAIEILRKTRPSIEDVARDVEAFELSVKNITDQDNLQPPMARSTKSIIMKNGIAGIACLVAEHFVGMDRVMYYTPRILVHVLQLDQYPAAASSKYLMLATLLTRSVISAIGTLLCIAFVDRYGRRRLLLLATFGIITCLSFLSFVLYGCSCDIHASCTITGSDGMGNLGLLALVALGLYFMFHSMGIGTIPWIIITEIQPLDFRIGFGFEASFTYWFTKVWIGLFYYYLDDTIGKHNIGNLFVILCLSSGLAFYIIYVFALDTTIEEVEELFLMEKISSSSDVEIVTTNGEQMPYMFSSSSSSDDE